MSDEGFFREVNEELRQDRVRAVWTRFGRVIIAAAILIILATVAYVLWEQYDEAQANAAGDAYSSAVALADEGKNDEALKALDALAADGYGAYPVLARMRAAAIQETKGDSKAAVAGFDAVAADSEAPQPVRDMAAVRAGYILVDTGSLDEVRSRVERLTGDSEALRHPAREILGLASWKAGDAAGARTLFQQLLDDDQSPQGISARARLMLDVISAGDTATGAPAPAAPAASTPPASSTN
ncbi:tetratricopeptide repeat protein [Mangrovicella endophytica]|uniref:tetratricopeptide repeat protein n=1 Tax=Mangrovicella endophytica TaxID=2066697 RepID=UPI000C9E3956|nr:tetratricopeptide repeat protein [Mangrovicella endophytica]